MVSLKLQKRLAASVMSCGKGKVWLDPNEATVIGKNGTSRTSPIRLAIFFFAPHHSIGSCASLPCTATAVPSIPSL